MSAIVDTVIEVTDPRYPMGSQVRCRLRLYQHGGRRVALVSELPDNPGASVTNAAETIASLVSGRWGFEVWIEHYPERGVPPLPETFDVVTFSGSYLALTRPPRWHRITREAVAALIGEEP